MSMFTYVKGFKPADEVWKKMKRVWDACEDLGIPIPSEVMTYFNDEEPGDKKGMIVDIDDACEIIADESSQGIEIDLEKVPESVRYIRFYNAW